MSIEYDLDFNKLLNDIDDLCCLSEENIEIRTTLECLYKIHYNYNYLDECLPTISTKGLLSSYIEISKKNSYILEDMALGEHLKNSINSSQETIDGEEVWL